MKLIRSALLAFISLVTVIAALSCGADPVKRSASFEINVYQSGGALEGPQTSLDAVLAQGRPVVLNFWAGMCPPCVEEMPLLEYASVQYLDDVTFLGIDIGPFMNLGTFEQGRTLLSELSISYPAGNTSDGDVLRDFNLTGLPVTVFIRPDGTINDRWTGIITWRELERRVDDLIEASA